MSLLLVELSGPSHESSVEQLSQRAREALAAAGASVVESSWAADLERLYVIVESEARDTLLDALRRAELPVLELAPVRLVGTPAEPGSITPSHLVEWDLPGSLGMDQYLQRKAEKTPLYAQVPEVKFLRTYVREDMIKCVCLYDAPDEAAVRRARQAVGAPVDRLTRLASTRDDE